MQTLAASTAALIPPSHGGGEHVAPNGDNPMQQSNNAGGDRATLYRMVLPDHVCPFGLKALSLLEDGGFDVDDRPLTSRDAVDAFKAEQGIETTPLVFVGKERIGGADALEAWLANRT